MAVKRKTLVRPQRTPDDMAQFMSDFQGALSEIGVAVGEEFTISADSDREKSPVSHGHDTQADDQGAQADEDELGPFSPDSETSREAAIRNYPRSGTQRWRVLTALVASADGRTRDQLAEALHLPDSSVDARVWELKAGGWIEESERKTRTRASAEAVVLVPTKKGRREVEGAEGFRMEELF